MKKIEKKKKKIRKTFTWDQERAQLMLWHIHINYIYISFSSSEVKNLWIKKCLKIFDTSPPQDKNKIGTKWQFDLSWSYHLLNQHQRDVWNAGVSFCVDKTCLREPPFPQVHNTSQWQGAEEVPRSPMLSAIRSGCSQNAAFFCRICWWDFFFSSLLFSSLSLFFFLAVYTCRLRLWGLQSF